MLGIESHPVPRLGFVPADGPDHWTAGTLFPSSSKKAARAINAASNNRPVVVLANLSGFDGSPESLRKLQLEYGAEIGRAVVNFKGPMVFCVISRYHGGAYVVFSHALNETIRGRRAGRNLCVGNRRCSGGGRGLLPVKWKPGPARMSGVSSDLRRWPGRRSGERTACSPVERTFKLVHSEKLGEVAGRVRSLHSVHRALEVGALHDILPAGICGLTWLSQSSAELPGRPSVARRSPQHPKQRRLRRTLLAWFSGVD